MRVLLSVGGTGGHIFPAQAVQEELENTGHEVYLAVDERYQKFGKIDGRKVFLIPSAPSGGSICKKIYSLIKIFLGILRAIFLLIKIKPDIVVGFGGYPSFPACIAAYILGIKMVIHEQNSVMGKANFFLSYFAKKVFLSFEKTLDIQNKQKSIYTGNPVRKQIMYYAVRDGQKKYNNDEKLNILVIGGSLGASALGKKIADAIISLPEEYRNKIKIVHQVAKDDINLIEEMYKSANIDANVSSFFEDMGKNYYLANLVISRSGATTIAELQMMRKKAILVPLKSFKDHQMLNAKSLEDKGNAWIMDEKRDFSIDNIKAKIISILSNPEILFYQDDSLVENPVYKFITAMNDCISKK